MVNSRLNTCSSLKDRSLAKSIKKNLHLFDKYQKNLDNEKQWFDHHLKKYFTCQTYIEYIFDLEETEEFYKNYKIYQDFFKIVHEPHNSYKDILNEWLDDIFDTKNEYYLSTAKNIRKRWFMPIIRSLTYNAYYIRGQAKYNHKLKRYINYPQLLELILNISPLLKEAYELKELYLVFNSTSDISNARIGLSEVINEYASSSIESYRRFSTTLIEWFDEIVNSFHTFNGQRISNAKIEGTNSRIKTILKNANGFRNFSRMRNRIMFSINKKSLPASLDQLQPIKMPRKNVANIKRNNKIIY